MFLVKLPADRVGIIGRLQVAGLSEEDIARVMMEAERVNALVELFDNICEDKTKCRWHFGNGIFATFFWQWYLCHLLLARASRY
jgi:hypothetical protein